jgi:DNA helicase-2/ATP-dependent DNA helicase PcrA
MLDRILEGLLELVRDEPDPEQALVRILGSQRILIIAPAGSGKTEALATRAASLAQRGLVKPPQQMLALTFTNRAVDNLTSRLRRTLGIQYDRYVAVHNFHGFGARLLAAHGLMVGISPGSIIWPDDAWRRSALSRLTPQRKSEVESLLRRAKSSALDDDAIIHLLRSSGLSEAVEYERSLQAEGRLDHDDVLRHAERLLQNEELAADYRSRYPVLLIDEVQDLTAQQLRIIRLLGGDSLTAAGDRTQSIFRFAGADPDRAFAELQSADAAVIRLKRSYRSAPKILEVVNALGALDGAEPIECADPSVFPDEGVVARFERHDVEAEATDLLNCLEERVLVEEDASVAIVIRGGSRGHEIEKECIRRGLSYQSWTLPTHDPDVVSVIRRHRHLVTAVSIEERLGRLRSACLDAVPSEEYELVDGLRAAFELISTRVEDGIELDRALDECRATGSRDQPIGPGIHLLNGHRGKGQQFDWVVILGAEEGSIPSFWAKEEDDLDEERRLFGVMASRARYGLVVTSVAGQKFYGTWRGRSPTRWLEQLEPYFTETW